ncbi:MAG: glycosyl transferase [Patescibacteria group bacterium]|nr:glycosyl transferase [Patescibacteria group bacterium]MDE2172642.1 glycosyl transferase [Patescibacteria group bacterium]
MTRHFCTLFDKGFLTRGMALHESLVKWSPDFVLWMMCNDSESYEMLTKLALPNVKLLKMSDVEADDPRVLAVKPSRKMNEYCWMFSSVLPLYILEHNPELDMITYLDADLYYYASPDPIYQEFGANSILIIPHGFSEKNKDKAKTSGIYNVGMMIFRNDQNGLECLRWWKDRVIEWCFETYENGKLGDQMYLNDWPTRFKSVHVLKNIGANVASWNIDRYKSLHPPLIFFHFHGLLIYAGWYGKACFYPATIFDRQAYRVYLQAIRRAYAKVQTIDPSWKYGFVKPLDIFRLLKQYIGLCRREFS